MNTYNQPGENLSGGKLLFARLAWAFVGVTGLSLFLSVIPAYLAQLQQVRDLSTLSLLQFYQLAPADVQALGRLGLSPEFYFGYFLTCEIIWKLLYFFPAAVIFWRKFNDRTGMLVSFIFLIYGLYATPTMITLMTSHSLWRYWVLFFAAVGLISSFTFFYVFPDGRFVLRWAPLAAAVCAVLNLALFCFFAFNPNIPTFILWATILAASLGLSMYTQVYRYRYISGPVERQQTKWVVLGLAGAAIGLLINLLLIVAFPTLLQPGIQHVIYLLVQIPFNVFYVCLIPLTITISIVRYHLWDIDLLIRRTLVYSALTTTLAIIYFGSVVLLQEAFRLLFGQAENEFVTVISTLAIAALFTPLRRRIQNDIDRRFYRRRYDAEQALAAFAASLRNEVDLDSMVSDLLSIVQDTIQPKETTLWLRKRD